MYYLSTVSSLNEEILRRRDNAESIREATDVFTLKQFGIPNFTDTIREYFKLKDGAPWGVLARQIASMCVEDVTCFIACNKIGLKPITLTFYRDTYTSVNHDKKSRIHVPWIWHSKKGNIVMERHTVVNTPLNRLERRIMSGIQTSVGMLLPQYHESVRDRAFSAQNSAMDVSALHARLFRSSVNRPSTVFVDRRGYDTSVPSNSVEGTDCIRPPAHWYYPLYLSLFLDGSMVLFETYEDIDSEVLEAKKMFESTVKLLETAIGWRPLIVEIPFSREMVFCNRHLLDSGRGVEIIENSIQDKVDNVLALCQQIAKKVIAYH